MRKLFTLCIVLGSVLAANAQGDITFKVDMNNYSGSFTDVHINGTFNAWCGNCNPMTDSDKDGVWEVKLPLPAGDIEYKFTVDGWTDQEVFAGGESCTVTNGGFTNRSYTVSGNDVLSVVCFNSCDICKEQIDLPIDFEGSKIDFTMTDFEGNTSELVEDPKDNTNMVLKATKKADAKPWAGTTLSTNAGLANAIAFDKDNNTMSVDVYSPDKGIQVRLKVEDHTDPTKSVETEATTTKADEWETLTFDFSNEATGTAAIDYGYTYDKASIFFNFGVDGATAGEKVYYCDNIKFGSSASSGTMITFQVDMNDYTGTYTKVNVNGLFNNWCGDCAEMTDADNDKVYELEVDMGTATSTEYKFTVDGWNDAESFAGGEACTKTTGPNINRYIEFTQDETLPVVCWESCAECGEAPKKADVTFKVDMKEYTESYTLVHLNGTFNKWCGACAEMTDEDNDDVYELTVTVNADDTIEYKFTVDEWTDQEGFKGGESCTKTTGEFTNRMLIAKDDVTLDPVCWESCNECGAVGMTGEVNELSFEAFPNPTTGMVNLRFEEYTNATIKVFNSSGHEVFVGTNAEANSQTVDLSNVPSGIYMLQVSSGDAINFEKIIVE